MINATDISRGVGFAFTQERFDYLCSDLNSFRVGRAVAASSNFPIAFSPLTVNAYPDACEYPKPTWLRMAEFDDDFSVNMRRAAHARVTWSYRDGENHPYLHLLDGGVADNIGLRAPLIAIETNDPDWSIPNMINNKKIEKLVVLIVDAKTRPTSKIDRSASPPGLFTVVETIATVPLDNYSFDTVDLLRQTFKDWQRDRQALWNDSRTTFQNCPPPPDNAGPEKLAPLDLYAIYVGFDQLKDPERRNRFLNMATSFHLPDGQVDKLIAVGPEIMEASESFTTLRDCLNR